MADHTSLQLALRARLKTLTVCETGAIDLSSTLTGYARPNGSFITDGFAIGMEVTPTGFTETSTGMITTLSALTMTIEGGRAVDAEAPSRSLAVRLPERQAWTNLTFEPTGGRPYIEEDYVPATRTMTSLPYGGGTAEDTGLYVVRWYARADTGLSALTRPADAILNLFPAGQEVLADSGDILKVRGDIGPVRGPLRQDSPGWAVVTVTIPWRVYSAN